MIEPSDRRRRTRQALAALILVLVAGNLARSTVVPEGAHFVFNVGMGVFALLLGRFAGTSSAELGTERRRVGSGLRLGGMAFALVAGAVVVAALVPALSGAFDDARADIGFGELVLDVLVLIPLGTVLVEELVFRGVLHALLLRLTSTWRAVAIGSLLFGLWHVFPAWRSESDNVALEDVSRLGTVVGTLVATTAAGLVFAWLRVRSGSLVAPILAHLATNTTALVAAWVLAH